ncbi:MAG TPA: hypothetical protein VI306_01100 [Pyrinomonadaceae bacterium]
MSIGKKVAVILVLISSLVLSPVLASAQGTSSSDWSSVRNLAVDTKVSVKLKTGKTVEGKVKSVSESSLTLTRKNSPVEVKRDDIASVYQVIKKSATKATLIGLGLGAGAGAGIGAIADASDDSGFEKVDHVATAGLAVAGAAAGAIAGYFIGKGSGKKILVYENK